MRTVAIGTTVIELLVYISLLGLVVVLLFSFVLRLHKERQGVLLAHVNLSMVQIASDLLVRDLRFSTSIELNRSGNLDLVCKTEHGHIRWQLDTEGVLSRTDCQATLKRPITAKVAENIKKVMLVKNGAQLVRISVVGTTFKEPTTRSVALRKVLYL